MKQFILSKEGDKDGIVLLKGNDYHHLVNVLRLATGEFFPALLPDGKETLVQILSIEHGVLIGKCNIMENFTQERENLLPPIILFQALPKGDKMDLIVRQAAEGGITEIVPFVSDFSVAKRSAEKGQKFLRWERIIKEARQQSGSGIATTLHRPLTRDELFDHWKNLMEKDKSNALGLLFHHKRGLEQNSLHGYLNKVPSTVAFVIGPEGGFSDKEVLFFLENGFKPLTVGDTVLRTETAALYCAAAIRILLWEKDSWKLKQAKSGRE
ncbi:MAG: 16S rRNA (uracil(1498)-N(3))-methyltransferase [Treponema sp.]|jgi:16S rRNA (uracil1498-N3)-methyltransferase|nr:16S rRNA (uracil(1498)-N(3))-methyltransferase [Treponema sp.]